MNCNICNSQLNDDVDIILGLCSRCQNKLDTYNLKADEERSIYEVIDELNYIQNLKGGSSK